MTEDKHTILHIEINNQYQMKCSVIDSDYNKHNIKIHEKQQDEYSPISITFEMNKIIITEERENSIKFINEFIDQPEEYKEYPIRYQNKEYKVIAEVLFAIIISQIINKIEKEWIIDDVILTIPKKNYQIVSRMRISLESIGIEQLTINSYDKYIEQGEILNEILNKNSEYEKYRRILEKNNASETEINSKPLDEERFAEMTKEKTRNKLCQLDNYCLFLASKWLDTIEDHINLVKTCRRLKKNMEKYHFNPIELTKKTREFFPYLQTLYLYNREDNRFENDERIIARKNDYIYNYLENEERKQLEEWTGKKCNEIVFDSKVDNWNVDTSEFDDKIKGKKELIFLIEDERSEKFGYYLNTQIYQEYTNNKIKRTDDKSFEFNLRSNGRLSGPMKFEIKKSRRGYGMNNKEHSILIEIGNIQLYKEKKKNLSYCFKDNENYFEYYGIENAVCGRTAYADENIKLKGDRFTPKRFLVIQMK